ncbi:hypothetical protein ABH15_08140 [Methanoculleus taiwanensis]|uniref:Uncharacterized protein n=1 Tax=Methanoculleus taiwanensis TaxID=1550565 RepID=A0A498GZQ1_9EURY|nr:hypothetical protein [Methanoculleus taiwanensis]RXE56129.1 hypothetical protein ABH15_08140 [Methanoculleus taiwanensis]
MRYHLPVIGLLLATVLVAGCLFGSSSPGVDLPYPPFRDASVIKFNPNGTVEWQTPLSFGRDTIPSTVTPLPNGSYAITGETIPGGENVSIPHSFTALLDANGSLVGNRTLSPFTDPTAGDANGTASWEKALPDWAAIRKAVPDSSGGYLIGGSAYGDAAIARVDAGGGVLWEQTVDEGDSALIWDISDLWEADGEIGMIYEVIRTGQAGSSEAVVATFGHDGTPAGRRTLDAFTPVLRLPDSGYVFAAFPTGEGSWYYYGTVLHLVRLNESGAMVWDSAVDLGEGSQIGSLVRTDDGSYIVAVTHGPAYGVSFPTASGGSAVSIAFRRG